MSFLQLAEPKTQPDPLTDIAPAAETAPKSTIPWLRRLWGGTLVVVGYLLSPLCWWNDLVINLPLALGFSQSLRNGLITSTVYTVAIVALIQLHILEMPDFLSGDLLATLDAGLPDWLMG